MAFISAHVMSRREAVQILMESPVYFKLSPADRKVLVLEFLDTYEDAQQEIASSKRNGSQAKSLPY